jgi:hypothetical protein
MQPSILFILKKRQYQYNDNPAYTELKSSGLFNSARFVHEMLLDAGYESNIVQVVDNNEIDRYVTLHDPSHVIIEALWVVPEKFEVLEKLHPNVKWIVRVHSEVPFLANEGIAMEWIFKYLAYKNVYVSFNSYRTHCDMMDLLHTTRLVYLPNYYPVCHGAPVTTQKNRVLDVGCFGAIRPMKNHVNQAIAAIAFARENRFKLNFHVNSERLESRGAPHLKNLRGIFDNMPDSYQLIEHGWMDHIDFIALVRQMDIGVQVSFSETFNIVSADFVANGIPMVTSNEIEFVAPFFQAVPTDVDDIKRHMKYALWYKKHFQHYVDINLCLLQRNVADARTQWLSYLYDEVA